MSDPIYEAQAYEIAKMARSISALEAENAKLRKLVQELWGRDADLYCSIDGICRDPLCKRNGECSLDNRMRELGIEV